MAKKKKKYVPAYPGGGSIFGFDIPNPTDTKSFEMFTNIAKLMEGMDEEKFANRPDVFVPMQGFYGFQYAEGGPMGQEQQAPPDMYNNGMEENYPLKSFLPFILDDPRNTTNAGNRKPMAIQTEKGEFIASPHGDLVQVAAKKKHKDMEDDEVTDITSEGNYVLSNSKSMTFKKGQKIKGVGMDSLTLGRSPIYYKENEVSVTPKVYKLSDIEPKKSKYTPADIAKRIARKFPLSTREDDPFATRAQVENKQSRIPYVKAVIALSELKKGPEKPEQFAMGGTIGPIDNAIKFNRFQIPQIDDLYKIPQFPSGGELGEGYGGKAYDYIDYSNRNSRKQFNSWLDQASYMYQDYFLNDAAKANDATSGIEAAAVMGQNKYKGDNEYLYGNQYFSRLNNLEGKLDRSFDAEQAYFQSAGDRENSVIRQGLNANPGINPEQLKGMRSNAIRQGNERIAGSNKDRRGYTDRYGVTRLTATDTYAGRQNQQKAYEVDFENNRLQNLGNIATKNIAGRLAAKSGALGAATQFQLAMQPGNALTDTFKAITDITALAANIGTALSGFGLLSGRGGSSPGGNGMASDQYGNSYYTGSLDSQMGAWGPERYTPTPYRYMYGNANDVIRIPGYDTEDSNWDQWSNVG